MKKYALIVLLLLATSGCCYNKQKIILEEPDFKAEKRVLVYENDAGIAGKLLRGALRKQGIKILKYTNKDILNINKKYSEDELYINVSSYTHVDVLIYILDLDGIHRTDLICPTKDVNYYHISIEIANLKTKEVVFSAEVAGGDDTCCWCKDSLVFDNAAKMIADFWKKQE